MNITRLFSFKILYGFRLRELLNLIALKSEINPSKLKQPTNNTLDTTLITDDAVFIIDTTHYSIIYLNDSTNNEHI